MSDEKELFDRDPDMSFSDFDIGKAKDPAKVLKRLFKSATHEKGRLIVVLCSVIIYTVLSIAAPWYSAELVNMLWESIKACRETGEVFCITWQNSGMQILILATLYFGSWVFSTLQAFLMASFSERICLGLRMQMSGKLNRLMLAYYDQHKIGEVLTHFTNDLDRLSEVMQNGLLKFLTSIGMIAGSLVIMLRFNWIMTLIFMGFMGLSMLITSIFSKSMFTKAEKRQEKMSAVTCMVEEYYTGRIIIKSFGREKISSEKMHRVNDELAKATEQADFVMNAVNPAIRLVNRFGQVIIAVVAGYFLIGGKLTVGAFQAFFQYLNQSAEPLTQASYILNSMQSAIASAERVFNMLDEVEISSETEHTEALNHVRGEVSFSHVRFGYTSEKELMKDISFTVKPGQKVAIVGSTGAGKTTLINLLMRFYEINSGRITLDGVDISSMTRKELRSHFGMVLQDTWIKQGTVRDNICFGRPDAAEEEIIRAAKEAHSWEFIERLPQGLDTVVGARGVYLSGGECQRIALARAILKDAPIVILDEATANVDPENERDLQRAIAELTRSKTVIMIAHRLKTVRDADQIVVLDGGRIVQRGTHDALMAEGGLYADFVGMRERAIGWKLGGAATCANAPA